MLTHRLSAGTTEDQVFQAQVDNAVADFTGAAIVLRVWDRYGTPVTVTGTVDWSVASTGTWR